MDLTENKVREFIQGNEKQKWRPVSNHNLNNFTEDEIKKMTENYSTLIGEGGFGEVYRGAFDDGRPVAVKILKNYVSLNLKEGFAKEIAVHCQINHKNVVRLLGYCLEENALIMVTEYMDGGSLGNILHGTNDPISLSARLGVAIDCADALCYMHYSMNPTIIHGDIKPDNILLDVKLGVKLADFGISRMFISTDNTHYTNLVVGSRGYVDPEHLETGRVDPKNDVYSFGVVLVELVTRRKVCENGINTGLIRNFTQALEKGKAREMFDAEIESVSNNMKVLEDVGQLAAQCLEKNIKKRAHMKYVTEKLRTIRTSHCKGKTVKTGHSGDAMAWITQSVRSMSFRVSGYGRRFVQIFKTLPEEKLKISYTCYLSTSAGPILGAIYISTAKIGFCSYNPVSNKVGNETEGSYYKVIIPLYQVRTVSPLGIKLGRSQEKYIQVISVDSHEFWFMGFPMYDKALSSLQEAMYTARGSNISSSTMFEEALSSSMEGSQGFESLYKMRRSTFNYLCSLVRVQFLKDIIARDRSFVDGSVLSLQDCVAVALRVLRSGESPKMVGSSIGVDESIASLVTSVFVKAMCTNERLYACWPNSASKMEKIKHKFDNIHGLPNCCGVVHRANIKFGSHNFDHEHNNGTQLQVVVGPDMRFTTICLDSSDGMDLLSMLHFSYLFKESEKGTWLNGTKLGLSDGIDVGEYIIGDSGYPLRPWLLTPYQLEGDLSGPGYKKEFNRRHSKATAVVVQRALSRLKDSWKCLGGEYWHPNGFIEHKTIGTCFLLHNIVIEMEEEEGPRIPIDEEPYTVRQLRQIASENAVRVRDALSRHLIISGETLSSSMEGSQGFESLYKMRRSTFNYLCSLVRVQFLEVIIARDLSFVDGSVFSLQDCVAVALRVLSSGESPEMVGSSIGVDESIASLVTSVFVKAMCTNERLYACWPNSASKMEKIKHKFDNIHGLPNCCGVVHRANIKFGSQNFDHEDNNGTLLQVVVGPDMRFTTICLDSSSSTDLLSLLHFSYLFKESEKGTWLNGTKLGLSYGIDVGEYIIGDSAYPLRPWLLTPYQLEGDLSGPGYKKEFNRRHSKATAVVVQRALSRLKDSWKCLEGKHWHPNGYIEYKTIGTCCLLHNIVIEMEEEEGRSIPSDEEPYTVRQLRQIASENAVRVRDALSQHLIKSGETLSSYGGRTGI